MGLWFLATSRQKLAGIITFAAGMVLVLTLAPEGWMDRMETIKEAESVNTFITRVEAWQVSSAIALENPLTGGGLHAVQVQSVWSQFKGSKGLLPFVDTGEPSRIFRAAHSIYFEVLGDMGFVGFALFLGVLLNAALNGVRVRRLTKGRENELEWATDLSNTLTAVIVTYMVGGLSVSLAYSEIIYVVVMLTEVLRREVVKVAGAAKSAPAAASSQSVRPS
jgi:probable O-glycosylation ligase (exosortase A-associated)